VDKIAKWEKHHLIFGYAQRNGRTFDEVWSNINNAGDFDTVITEKIMNKDLDEYDERFQYFHKQISEAQEKPKK